MFKCVRCNRKPEPGETPNQVVVETRLKQYPSRSYYPPSLGGRATSEDRIDDKGGAGYETVRVELVCDVCVADDKVAALAEKFDMSQVPTSKLFVH